MMKLKPVNPNQILLSLKKNLDHSRLISEKTTSNYQQEFRKIAMDLSMVNSYEEWVSLYQKLIYWEIQLEDIEDAGMFEIFESQKNEANLQFGKFIEKNYADWFQPNTDAPIMSHRLFKEKIAPEISKEQPTLLVVIDNLRYDQWKVFEPIINNYFKKDKEDAFFSILPTATQYARNAIFSGLMPSDMEKLFPQYWKNDTDEGGKNMHEADFLESQMKRLSLNHLKYEYHKITNLKNGKKLADNFRSQKDNDLTVVVYKNPSKVIGNRDTSLNLRYKTGRSLTYDRKDVLESKEPKELHLPTLNMSSSFIFAKSDLFFAYPNNYNHYVSYYRNTYQHGGVSLEEMIIPFVVFNPK